eukprot:TRINITY_DN16302_c0_g1_i1.p1 TRINITY_DN16302_c0_g1~~TRINITY_DN16302_c0_g1_i1.p1  ORF type:complete len:214 (+),score=11.79 TRINITY_DN16302_c0_g1_i1:87-728(+)
MSFDYDFEESETESSDESDDLGQNIVSLDEGKPNIRKEFTIDEHHDFRPRDSVMPFWATISGNQSRFLSSSGTAKNSQLALAMEGVAKPTRHCNIKLKTVQNCRFWVVSWANRERSNSSWIVSFSLKESRFPLQGVSIHRLWRFGNVLSLLPSFMYPLPRRMAVVLNPIMEKHLSNSSYLYTYTSPSTNRNLPNNIQIQGRTFKTSVCLFTIP